VSNSIKIVMGGLTITLEQEVLTGQNVDFEKIKLPEKFETPCCKPNVCQCLKCREENTREIVSKHWAAIQKIQEAFRLAPTVKMADWFTHSADSFDMASQAILACERTFNEKTTQLQILEDLRRKVNNTTNLIESFRKKISEFEEKHKLSLPVEARRDLEELRRV
jgi:hypothetical protein